MEKHLVGFWNETVKNHSDIVYILGDFTLQGRKSKDWFLQVARRLRGRKILVLGNHDILNPFDYVDAGFESVHTSLVFEQDKLFMCHDPAWSVAVPNDYITLCGHVHDSFKLLKDKRTILNVGVDVWDYRPIPLGYAIGFAKTAKPDENVGSHRTSFLLACGEDDYEGSNSK